MALEKQEHKVNVDEMIQTLVDRGEQALNEYLTFTQKQIDKIVHAMVIAGVNAHQQLAIMTVEETRRGVVEDKVIKNLFATEYIWHSIKNEKSVGLIRENELDGTIEIAEPVGIIAGVTPVTNPTSTAMFKAIIAVKSRNPIIFGFHPSAQRCSSESTRILYEAALAAGAPEHCIQWIETPSVEATSKLMNHPKVSLILATGGSGMVRSAYTSGKPALGVGPGNVPCYIEKTANVKRACTDLMLSKTFDNGMICASESAVIVDKEIQEEFEAFMKENNCYFLNEQEIVQLTDYMFPAQTGYKLNGSVAGQPAAWIAEQAGIQVDPATKILLARLPEVGRDYPLSKEKLSPVLAYYVVEDSQEGFEKAQQMLELGGLGHSAVIHSKSEELCKAYGNQMRVGRIITNSPSSQGAIGDIYNANTPSLTLGCGSYGNNSTTQNVSSVNLINKKIIANRKNNMQWFKIPQKIYFEEGSIKYLENMPNISRAFIVTDKAMVKLGYIDKILFYLRRRKDYVHSEIFADVEPDPSVETIMRGVEEMRKFNPDVIIALGGGSAMDAAKGMWLFYEQPETSFDGIKLKFLDIRKRSFQFPQLGKLAQMVCIPTTSGTGSEVTCFSVITDHKAGDIKYPLADYELTPDVAIIDPQFCYTMPKSITADTGLDVLTHAIEAYVSVLASDFTDGLAMKAIELVFKYLPRAYHNGEKDEEAREKMHNASAIAGMAFTNAFLGVNHSLAHKIGGEYHVSHGRANAVLLPYVIKYNSQSPTKFATWPKYEKFIADQKYAEIARYLGLKADTVEEGVNSLIEAIIQLQKEIEMPVSFLACGLHEEEYIAKLETIAARAFEDQCTTTNPRYPLIKELAHVLKQAYYGKFDC